MSLLPPPIFGLLNLTNGALAMLLVTYEIKLNLFRSRSAELSCEDWLSYTNIFSRGLEGAF